MRKPVRGSTRITQGVAGRPVRRAQAARSLRRTVAADQAAPIRIYVVAPAGTAAQDFSFTVRALDAEGGSDSHQTRFDGPGDE